VRPATSSLAASTGVPVFAVRKSVQGSSGCGCGWCSGTLECCAWRASKLRTKIVGAAGSQKEDGRVCVFLVKRFRFEGYIVTTGALFWNYAEACSRFEGYIVTTGELF